MLNYAGSSRESSIYNTEQLGQRKNTYYFTGSAGVLNAGQYNWKSTIFSPRAYYIFITTRYL